MGTEAADYAFSEEFVLEDRVLMRARDLADQLGCVPVSPAAGQLLTVLAAAKGVTSAVEVGTGVGISTTYLLRGMPSGTVTTIDAEPDHHKEARETVRASGFEANRVRMITGRALDVLPRLADAAYDLAFVDAAKEEYPVYLTEALRLLKPGGLLVMDNALGHGRTADPARRDEETTAIRATVRAVKADEELTPVLLHTGDGVLIAVKTPRASA